MKTSIPCSISIDQDGNRYYSQAYKPAVMPKGKEWQFVAPMVMIPSELVNEAIEEHKKGNQDRVNEILSKYY